FEQPKIIYPNICSRNEFAWDNFNYYTNQKAYIIPTNDKVLLAVLNSSVLTFLFDKLLAKLQGNFYEPSSIFMKNFPIPNVSPEQKQTIETLVQKCLTAKGQNCQQWEKEIDQIVYQLYDLTPAEIALIENP
ncbi:MAG: TaqI-like C-terminal specificity domain-containing protein, partial [Microcystaceae cyanobacterium]